MRILLVEPNPETARAFELMLVTEGFNVYATDSGEEALDLGKLYDYDAIILETKLPDVFGLDVLRDLRRAKVQTPVLICSGEKNVDNRLSAFSLGADDYVEKPFHRAEMIARIHAVVRRSKGHAENKINIGDKIVVNLTAKACLVDGSPVHLTGKEFAMVELLALRKGTVITKDMFLNHLYGGMDEPELKIIDVFICKLRKKLAAANEGRHCIDTVWGRGYTVRSDDFRHDTKPTAQQVPVTPVNNHQPNYDANVQSNEVATLMAQLEEMRLAMGLSTDASMEETMAALQAFKARGERMLEDEVVEPAKVSTIGTSVVLAGEFANTSRPVPPKFENGLRLPIGNVFRIGNLVEVDTSEGKAANIQTEYEVTLTPIVGSILEILSFYQGQGLNKQALLRYLFEKENKTNETKLGMYMSQAQGVLTQLVGRNLASMFVQVLSGGGYGMPDAGRLLGYAGTVPTSIPNPEVR